MTRGSRGPRRAVAGLGIILVILVILTTAGCAQHAPERVRSASVASHVALPPPATDGDMSVERALERRRSIRDFDSEELTTAQLGQLLWAGQGVTGPNGQRTAPSAGALFPLELYAVTARQVLHYLPDGHRAEVRTNTDLRAELADAALGQDVVSAAPVVIVVAAAPDRTRVRYGARATTFVDLEAGHAAENMLLQATAMGLGAVPIGAFDPERVASAVPLPPGQVALYLIPVGHPR